MVLLPRIYGRKYNQFLTAIRLQHSTIHSTQTEEPRCVDKFEHFSRLFSSPFTVAIACFCTALLSLGMVRQHDCLHWKCNLPGGIGPDNVSLHSTGPESSSTFFKNENFQKALLMDHGYIIYIKLHDPCFLTLAVPIGETGLHRCHQSPGLRAIRLPTVEPVVRLLDSENLRRHEPLRDDVDWTNGRSESSKKTRRSSAVPDASAFRGGHLEDQPPSLRGTVRFSDHLLFGHCRLHSDVFL